MATTTNDTAEMTETQRQAATLRVLADLLEANPHLTPIHDFKTTLSVFCETQAELHAWMRMMPGVKSKQFSHSGSHMLVEGKYEDIPIRLWIIREEVCTRVVIGTREVTKTVPAPDAPMIEVTETEEVVEWVCEPVLAEAAS